MLSRVESEKDYNLGARLQTLNYILVTDFELHTLRLNCSVRRLFKSPAVNTREIQWF